MRFRLFLGNVAFDSSNALVCFVEDTPDRAHSCNERMAHSATSAQNIRFCLICVAAYLWLYDGFIFNLCPHLPLQPMTFNLELRPNE